MNSLDSVNGSDFRKFLTIELFMSAICNAAINVGMVYLVFGGRASIPILGPDGVALDLVPTAFLTGLLMTLMLTPILRRRVHRGSAPSIHRDEMPSYFAWLPKNFILRGALIGLIGLAVAVPISLLGFNLLEIESISFSSLILFKSGFGTVIGVAMVPAIIFPAIVR